MEEKKMNSMMESTIKPTLILVTVAFISAFVLSHVKRITEPNIKKQQQEKQSKALAIVLPGYGSVEEKSVTLDGGTFTYWKGTKTVEGVETEAHAFKTASPGYSGDVISMVGVGEDQRILGLYILEQTETPGLGARCTEVASTETFTGTIASLFSDTGASQGGEMRAWFQEQFTDLTLGQKIRIFKRGDWSAAMKDELVSQNGITAITGATITGRTVITSLEEGIARLNKALATEVEAEAPEAQ